MTDFRVKTLTLDPVTTAPMIIQHGYVNITDTTLSEDTATGALVVDGGLAISTTADSNGSTVGGALSVAGGLAVLKRAFIAGDVTLDNTTNFFRVNGISSDRFFIDTTANAHIFASPDGVNNRFDLTDTELVLNITKPSTGSSTGALVVNGGVSIGGSTNSLGLTNGGSLTVAGGMSVAKTGYIGLGLNSSHDSNTLGSIVTTGANVGINNTAPSHVISAFTDSDTAGLQLSWTGNTAGSVRNFTITVPAAGADDDCVLFSTNNCFDFQVDAVSLLYMDPDTGTPQVGINTTDPQSTLHVNGQIESTTITTGDIFAVSGIYESVTSDTVASAHFTGGEMSISGGITAASVTANAISVSDIDVTSATIGALVGTGNVHTLGSIVTTGGHVGIEDTAPAFPLTFPGVEETKIALWHDDSFTNIYGLGVTTDQYNFITPGTGLKTFVWYYGGTSNDGTQLMSLNTNQLTISEPVRATDAINTIGSFIFTDATGVAIGKTAASYLVDINGQMGVSSITTGTLEASGTLINGGFDFILGTTDQVTRGDSGTSRALVKNTGNVLVVNFDDDFSGGTQIGNNSSVIINGPLMSANTSNTLGSLFTTSGNVGIGETAPSATLDVNGSVLVQSTDNSVGLGTGGALTVLGGASFDGDVYIGGNIVGPTTGSTTLNQLQIGSSDAALNFSTGALISEGGITIKISTNSSSITNGGALLVGGGAAVGRDLYLGGNGYFESSVEFQVQTNDFVNLVDNTNLKKWSLDKDTSTHNFSLSRYDAGGSFAEKTFDISRALGTVQMNNTTPSTSGVSASLVLAGGVSIGATEPAAAIGNGGSLTVIGGTAISKNLIVGGDVMFDSVTDSSDISSGALLLLGGAGISKNLNVGGNATILGNLTVNGTISSIVSTNTEISDNILVLNSGPSGSRDSGYVVHRFQEDNDTASGDVINDVDAYVEDTLPSQSGMTSTQIKLSASASGVDDFYNGWWVRVTSGFSNNQVRRVTDYDGTTKIATVTSAWTTQNPAGGDTVQLYYRGYVGAIYDEVDDLMCFGTTALDPPTSGSVSFTGEIGVKMLDLTLSSTQASTSDSVGGLVLSGGIGVMQTTDASSNTDGGSLTVAGGGAIGKTLYVGDALYVNGFNITPSGGDILATTSFTGANNQSTFADVTGLNFMSNVWGFDAWVATRIDADTDLYVNFLLRGVNKGSSWELVKTYVGDDSGIEFDITAGGQVQYTSQNYTGFNSLIFRFKAQTN